MKIDKQQTVNPEAVCAKILVNFIVIFLICLLLSACNFMEDPVQKLGRFEVVGVFYAFDGSVYMKKSKIIKDRISGNCYFYLWGGEASGGPAMCEVKCR